jgi:hypothetical protein
MQIVASVTFLWSESGGTARLYHLPGIWPNWQGGHAAAGHVQVLLGVVVDVV